MSKASECQGVANKLLAQFREATGRNVWIEEKIRTPLKLAMLHQLLTNMDPSFVPYDEDGLPIEMMGTGGAD